MTARTALAILTYVEKGRPAGVRQRLRDAVASLGRTDYDGPAVIVDDGSTCEQHLDYLDLLARSGRFDVLRRASNGGISRAKNTCLKEIAAMGVAVGFLAEDDILFREGWQRAYLAAMKQSRVHHFSWYPRHAGDAVVACNGGLITRTSGLLGLLLTFTPEIVSTVGGFKVLPHRYGFEHIQWTHRNIMAGFAPFPCDIVNSRRFIRRSSLPASIKRSDIAAGIARNRRPGHVIGRLFEPLEE